MRIRTLPEIIAWPCTIMATAPFSVFRASALLKEPVAYMRWPSHAHLPLLGRSGSGMVHTMCFAHHRHYNIPPEYAGVACTVSGGTCAPSAVFLHRATSRLTDTVASPCSLAAAFPFKYAYVVVPVQQR